MEIMGVSQSAGHNVIGLGDCIEKNFFSSTPDSLLGSCDLKRARTTSAEARRHHSKVKRFPGGNQSNSKVKTRCLLQLRRRSERRGERSQRPKRRRGWPTRRAPSPVDHDVYRSTVRSALCKSKMYSLADHDFITTTFRACYCIEYGSTPWCMLPPCDLKR